MQTQDNSSTTSENATPPKVTVVTVCFNALQALKKTCRSVLAQSYANIEYIIIDGASADGTPQWLQTLDTQRVRWMSEPDRGIYDAMNKGAALAAGEWIIFMNAGDTFASADTIAQVFSEDVAEADIVYGDVRKNGAVKKAEPPHNSHRMFFCHQCVFTRATLCKSHPFDLRHAMSADFKFFKTMIAQQRRFMQLDMTIADFDTSGVSNTRRADGLRDNIAIVCEIDTLKEKLRLLPHLLIPYIICRVKNKVGSINALCQILRLFLRTN